MTKPKQQFTMADKLFDVDDRVAKTGGDYIFSGNVRAVFKKKSGAVRYVIENDQGILHIFNHANLMKEEA